MNLIKPPKLKIGDTIGIVATSGPIKDRDCVERAKKLFEDRGYKVILADNLFEEDKYLAGDDDSRKNELHKFFEAEEINAIICLRGGFGAIRIIEKIDCNIIQKNPKIFCGYSDVSALSAMFLKRCGLMTFSGPMIQSDFGAEKISDFTIDSFFEAITSDKFTLTGNKIYSDGSAEGLLWGGNLATIASLCGLDFIPDEKFIFFTEDLNEQVYKIDKYFRQLLNIKEFRENISGIVLGDFLNVDNEEWLEKFFNELAEELQIPIISGFKITHKAEKATLPYGACAKIDGFNLNIEY